MIKRIIKKYQAYKDKRFLVRLERVLKSNIIQADLLLGGNAIVKDNACFMMPKLAMEDILTGIPLNLVLKRLHQGYYERQDHLQSD